jgi:hypothetical protein
MERVLSYKANGQIDKNLYSALFALNDVRVMLWAGDCVHAGIPDVQRLPGYDLYVCFGFNDLYANIQVLPPDKYICLIDIHDKDQFIQFISHFGGRCSIIDSDYHGSTPRISLDFYSLLLTSNGLAYHTGGITSGFSPEYEFKKYLELFAPALPPALKDARQWTPQIIKLAEWNAIPPSFVYTDHELKHGSYKPIWESQQRFKEEQERINPVCGRWFQFTEETLEEYWGILPDSILTVYMRVMFDTLMSPEDKAHLESFYKRFREFLWLRVITRSMNNNIMVHDLYDHIYGHPAVKDQIYALQQVLGLLTYAEEAKLAEMTPTISYYIDSRRQSPERVYGLWLRNT